MPASKLYATALFFQRHDQVNSSMPAGIQQYHFYQRPTPRPIQTKTNVTNSIPKSAQSNSHFRSTSLLNPLGRDDAATEPRAKAAAARVRGFSTALLDELTRLLSLTLRLRMTTSSPCPSFARYAIQPKGKLASSSSATSSIISPSAEGC